MARLFGSLFLAVSSAFCLFTAASSFLAPGRFGARLGYAIEGFDGLNEVRAQYGGFFLAVAILGGLALAGKVSRTTALVANVVVFGGLITGRLASLVLDGGIGVYGPTIQSLFFIDSFGFVTSSIALALAVREEPRRFAARPMETSASRIEEVRVVANP